MEMIRVTDHGGVVFILDYQRDNSCEFLEDLKKRLMFTKPEIVPLFIDSISACFSKKEIEEIFNVKVDSINTLIRANKKIAYVKLNGKNPAIDIATQLGLM